MEGVKFFPQGRPRDCSLVDLRALICCDHDSCLVFRHPIGVDVCALYFQQEFGHVLKERVGDVPSSESFCEQGVLAVMSFQELCREHLELSFANAVQVEFLAHHGVCQCFDVKLGCDLRCVWMWGRLSHLDETLQAAFCEPFSECRGDDGRHLWMMVIGSARALWVKDRERSTLERRAWRAERPRRVCRLSACGRRIALFSFL